MKPGKNRPDEEAEQPTVTPETPPGEPLPGDARSDPEKRKENRDKLGVDDTHKTSDMKKGHRGTFP